MNLREPEPDNGVENVHDVESTRVGSSPAAPDSVTEQPPVSAVESPVLGIVVVYSETHESDNSALDPRLGRIYPLREGEVLFVGRPPAPAEVLLRSGESTAPTHSHLFPHGEPYGYVSRRHLTIELDPLGGAVVTDHSRYGIYLERAARVHRREDPNGPPESHHVDGQECVILMDDLGEPTDRDLVDRRSHYRLQILPSARTAAGGAATEKSP